ncbi:hypothetical protein ACFZDB_30640 [Streptomyces luteogriseus]|uniref:hypothetical protein n=1 Tax=Streptomyces luteogriseus TaxID=68233 RepID=UPI0036EDEC5D
MRAVVLQAACDVRTAPPPRPPIRRRTPPPQYSAVSSTTSPPTAHAIGELMLENAALKDKVDKNDGHGRLEYEGVAIKTGGSPAQEKFVVIVQYTRKTKQAISFGSAERLRPPRLIKNLLADRLLFMGSVGRATRSRIGKCR